MRARYAVLATRSVSSRPTHLRTSSQSACESPQILFFVFKRLRTLSFSVSSKSFTCHSYENCRVCTNNSQTGTPHELAPSEADGLLVYPEPNVRRGTVLKFFLFFILRTLLHNGRSTTPLHSSASALFPSQRGCGGTPLPVLRRSDLRPLPLYFRLLTVNCRLSSGQWYSVRLYASNLGRKERIRMCPKTTIGILTGGGDVPGLNPVIKSVVYRATELGRQVIGIRKGWEGLTHLTGPDDETYIRPLTRENTRTIDRSGGTILHTSRTNPKRIACAKAPKHIPAARLSKLPSDGKYYDFTPIVLENVERLDIGCLVTIVGDDTLSFSSALSAAGMPLLAIPKTMDNDGQGTEYCIGFSTPITPAKELITRQRTTLGSHERIGVFRIFGRDAGFTALYTSYVTSTRCLIPEYPFDLDHVAEILAEDKRNSLSHYALVVVSEGATWKEGTIGEYGEADAYGHRKKVDVGHALAEELKKRTGEETMVSDLTYDLRSGEPDAIDQLVAITFANLALDLIHDGVTGRMVAVQNGCYTHINLPDSALGPRKVDVATLYNTERYRPNYSAKLGAPLLLNRL